MNQTPSLLVHFAIALKEGAYLLTRMIVESGSMLGIGTRKEPILMLVIGISDLVLCRQAKRRLLKRPLLAQRQSRWRGFLEPRITERLIWSGEVTDERLKESGNPLCASEIRELCEKRKRWREEMLNQ